jgi:signal transduction histidine kinase/CheY-like chemotaxis protein
MPFRPLRGAGGSHPALRRRLLRRISGEAEHDPMPGPDRRKRTGESGGKVVALRSGRAAQKPELPPPSTEQVELLLAEMAARVSDAAAVPEAERTQLALIAELLRPRAVFVSHFVESRGQLQVMSVRGRNDARIAAAEVGEGVVGKAFQTVSVVREKGAVSAPLVARKKPVGCVTVLDPKVAVSNELMKALAAHLASAWEVGRLHDESVRRTRDLETAVSGLKSIERGRDELLAHASHDLKNPLATVKAYLSMLDREKLGPLTDKQSHALEVCQRNADRLTRLINELVLLSRLKAGDMRLDEKPFGLKAVAEEVLQATSPMALQGNVAVELARGGEVFVRGDRERVMEAICNVVEQAIYTTTAGKRVRLEVGTDDAGLARLTVLDQGPPVPAAELDHLFDTWPRAGAPRPRRFSLGLPIAAKIVRLHGGRINAAPAGAQGGTRVDLCLPLYAGSVMPTELSEAPRSGGILLVEDDADCREVLHEVLEQEGYRVITAASGAEARAVLAHIRPALIFLDIHLRDEDGRNVLRFIRESPALAQVPVFVISGDSDLGGLVAGRGPDRIEGFLEKPIQLPRLLDTVASVVRPRRQAE